MDIAKQIKAARTFKGWTQAELAEKLKVTRSTVSGWEVGRNQPDLSMALALSEVFQVSLDKLFKGESIMEKVLVPEKPLALGRSLVIENDQGQKVVTVKEVGVLPTPRYFHLIDDQGEKFGEIVRKRWYYMPRFYLQVTGFTEVRFFKDIEALRMSYHLEGEKLAIVGDWLSHSFRVEQNGQTIATVVPMKQASGNYFEVSILSEEKRLLIIGFAVLMSMIYENERGSVKNN